MRPALLTFLSAVLPFRVLVRANDDRFESPIQAFRSRPGLGRLALRWRLLTGGRVLLRWLAGYKLGFPLLLIILPAQASEKMHPSYTYFAASYNVRMESYSQATHAESGAALSAFGETLQRKGVLLEPVDSPANADFIFTIVTTPTGVPDSAKVDLPNCCTASQKHTSRINIRRFHSPWMSGKVYFDASEVSGAEIVVYDAPLLRIQELHLAFLGQWDAILEHKVTDLLSLALTDSTKERLLKRYEEAFFTSPNYRPSTGHIRETFEGDGSLAVALGAVAAISWQSTRGPFENSVVAKQKECLAQASTFYEVLYRRIFENLLDVKNPGLVKENELHPILSKKELEKIANEVPGYNCFNGSRLDERK